MSYISDFHTHIALKAANNEAIQDIWERKSNKPPKKFLFFFNALRKLALDKYYNDYATYTQCDLGNCVDGQVRLINCAIYPIERQYIHRRSVFVWLVSIFSFFHKKFPFIQLFNKKRNLLVMMFRVLQGTSKIKALAIWNEQKSLDNYIDYFEDYKIELDHLIKVHGIRPSNPLNPNHASKVFKLVKNYEELKGNLNNTDVISGIVSLEGLHGLGKYKFYHLFKTASVDDLTNKERTSLLQKINLNLRRIKENDYTPLYITMAHHYNNLICGHVKSFNGFITLLFKQKRGMNLPITDSGKMIIENMLARNTGIKRILIDVKHMSIMARKEYYEIVRNKNDNRNIILEELGVPIISSHSAVSGVKTWDEAQKIGCNKKDDKNSYVSRCDVNLCDEDIIEIYNSDGLIGVLMHEGRMPGKIYKKRIRNTSGIKKRTLQIQLFLTNVYHIVQVIDQELMLDGWKVITLGSDMDGLIDPFDDYKTAGSLMRFRNDVYTYLDNYSEQSKGFRIKNILANTNGSVEFSNDEVHILNHGRSVSEVVDGIFYKHSEKFLSKYFTNDYLHGIGSQHLIS